MENTNTNIQNDNLLFNWLPNCEEMLKMTLNNPNIVYYPSTSNDILNYKVFDFTSQRAMDTEEDFVAVDQKQVIAGGAKQKAKPQAKKTTQGANANKKNMNSKQPQVQTGKRTLQTIQIQPDWKSLTDFGKQSLEKLRIDIEPEVEDLLLCGNLYKISEDFEKDRVNSLNPIPLNRFENFKFFGNLSTLQDEKMKSGTQVANVFITDKLLSVIMTMVFNSRPWHLKITKVGDSIFFDKMPNSEVDFITVNESAENIPSEEDDKNIDSFHKLAVEATLINEFIKEQIIDTTTKFEDVNEPHPFTDEKEENVERLAYRYRVWRLV